MEWMQKHNSAICCYKKLTFVADNVQESHRHLRFK